MRKIMIVCAALALAGWGTTRIVSAQENQKGSAKGAAVLHPEMTVAADAGTFDKPMGSLGTKPSEPWTQSTMTAGVNGRPQRGQVATVTGEVIDMSCYLQLGKHGEKHVACGKKCLTAGQPIGLLTADGRVYMLMEEEHDPRRDGQTSDFRKAAVGHLGHIMEVSGTEAQHAGFRALYVQGYVGK